MNQIHLGSFELETKGKLRISCDFYIPKIDFFPDVTVEFTDELLLSKTSLQKDPVFYQSIKDALKKIGYDIKDGNFKVFALGEKMTLELPEDFLKVASAKGFLNRLEHTEEVKREALREVLDLDSKTAIDIDGDEALVQGQHYLILEISQYADFLIEQMNASLTRVPSAVLAPLLNLSGPGLESLDDKMRALDEKKNVGALDFSAFVFEQTPNKAEFLKSLASQIDLDDLILNSERVGIGDGFLILKRR